MGIIYIKVSFIKDKVIASYITSGRWTQSTELYVFVSEKRCIVL